MIKLKVRGGLYTIREDYSVSYGIAKEFIEQCIEMIRLDYDSTGGPANGFFPIYLYIHLADFKSITPVSIDYTPPEDDGNIEY